MKIVVKIIIILASATVFAMSCQKETTESYKSGECYIDNNFGDGIIFIYSTDGSFCSYYEKLIEDDSLNNTEVYYKFGKISSFNFTEWVDVRISPNRFVINNINNSIIITYDIKNPNKSFLKICDDNKVLYQNNNFDFYYNFEDFYYKPTKSNSTNGIIDKILNLNEKLNKVYESLKSGYDEINRRGEYQQYVTIGIQAKKEEPNDYRLAKNEWLKECYLSKSSDDDKINNEREMLIKCPAKIVNFKQTKVTPNNNNDEFEFSIAVKLEQDEQEVEDWGYVAQNLTSNELNFISLKEQKPLLTKNVYSQNNENMIRLFDDVESKNNQSYVNNTYIHYREDGDIVCVYGYTKYHNESNFRYDIPSYYSLKFAKLENHRLDIIRQKRDGTLDISLDFKYRYITDGLFVRIRIHNKSNPLEIPINLDFVEVRQSLDSDLSGFWHAWVSKNIEGKSLKNNTDYILTVDIQDKDGSIVGSVVPPFEFNRGYFLECRISASRDSVIKNFKVSSLITKEEWDRNCWHFEYSQEDFNSSEPWPYWVLDISTLNYYWPQWLSSFLSDFNTGCFLSLDIQTMSSINRFYFDFPLLSSGETAILYPKFKQYYRNNAWSDLFTPSDPHEIVVTVLF